MFTLITLPAKNEAALTILHYPTLLFTLLLLSLFGPLCYSQTEEATVTPVQAQSGQLLMRTNSGGYTRALNLSANAEVNIHGLTAQVSLTQRFENNSDDWREAIYVFPLPENAAVHAMQIRIGERIIIGRIKEREAAKAIYQQAKRAGKLAALTEQERPNLFTQNLANIPPHATVAVELQYQHQVHYDLGAFSWRLPLTLTPRYIPGTPEAVPVEQRFADLESTIATTSGYGWALPTRDVPDADRITPPMHKQAAQQNVSLQITLDSGLQLTKVSAPYHAIDVQEHQGIHTITLTQQQIPMDRDFVLEWIPATGTAPSAGVFSESTDNARYASVVLVPPQNLQKNTLQRDLVFVIDTSGSMAGVSIRQARESLSLALQRLQPGDRFNVIQFNSSFSRLFSGLTPATASNIARAQQWVGSLNADGGTEMLAALDAAIANFHGSERLQQLVFVTDGAIGNETQLLQRIQNNLGAARLFAVGIGSAPNAYFMKKAAQIGHGANVTIGDISEVANKMNELFLKLETAMVTNIQIDWGGDVEQYPERIQDLYAGEPIVLTAKIPANVTEVTLRGKTQTQQWSKTLSIGNNNAAGIGRNWARAKIEALEDSKIAGADKETVRNQVLALALEHQLVSAYTSFVAVEQTPSRPPATDTITEAVPNAMPQGSLQAVPFAHTATPAPLMLWLGSLAFAAFVWLRKKAV